MRWYLMSTRYALPVLAVAALFGGLKFGVQPMGWSRGA
jgi:hypothetical protein